MAEKKTKKNKVEIQTRSPQRRGIFDNLGSDRKKDSHPLSEIMNLRTRDEQEEIIHPIPSQDNPRQPKVIQGIPTEDTPFQIRQLKIETSPVKNFTKVPNSLTEKAIPQKLFKGLSKHTYDILYKQTRGAIVPARQIQLTKAELMNLTGLSENTVSAHLKHLREVKLISSQMNIGKHEGSIYEVFVPEEIGITLPYPTHPNISQDNQTQANISRDETTQNLVPVPTQNLGGVGGSKTIENTPTYVDAKTSLKTNTNDDEKATAFSEFIERFSNTSQKLTGKEISGRDSEKWDKLAQLLILELEIAAKRTDSISSVPAFLTEVLRRQFFSSRQQKSSSAKSSKIKIDTVGKSDSDSYEIKSLDKQGREAALEQLREFANDEFLQDFKKWYTSEDWEWLIKEIEKSSALEKIEKEGK